jgi:hypothetical protein
MTIEGAPSMRLSPALLDANSRNSLASGSLHAPAFTEPTTTVNPASVIAEFTRHHNFAIPEMLRDDTKGIQWLHDVKLSIDGSASSQSERLVADGDPSWAMILTMLDRVYEHAAASLVAYFTGTWASMEVVVRTTIEAAATVLYVTRSDRNLRLGQYLTHFFATSRKAIGLSDPSVQARASQDLDARENLIRQVAAHEGIPLDVLGWPSLVRDRFKAAGMEKEYRHIYAVLSGQVHSDADALVDYVIARCLAQHDPSVEAVAATELQYWMRFYLYSGLRYYALAAQGYATALEFVSSITDTQRIEKSLVTHLQRLSDEFQQFKTNNKMR